MWGGIPEISGAELRDISQVDNVVSGIPQRRGSPTDKESLKLCTELKGCLGTTV